MAALIPGILVGFTEKINYALFITLLYLGSLAFPTLIAVIVFFLIKDKLRRRHKWLEVIIQIAALIAVYFIVLSFWAITEAITTGYSMDKLYGFIQYEYFFYYIIALFEAIALPIIHNVVLAKGKKYRPDKF